MGDVIDNVDGFFSGDFHQGGWPAWFRVHTQLQNNPYGAYLLAHQELTVRLNSRRNEETKLLEFGSGFFSKQVCQTVNGEEVCSIVTPGTQIEDTVARALGIGTERLIIADEIDEIVNALIAFLAREALTGVDGLLGLSQRSSSSSQSFTDSVGQTSQLSFTEAAVAQTQQASVAAAQGGLLAQTEQSIDIEQEFIAVTTNAQTLVANATPEIQECFLQTINGSQPLGLIAGNSIESADALVAYYESEIEASESNIAVLEDLRDRIASAQSAEELNALTALYNSIVTSGAAQSFTELGQQQAVYQTLVAVNEESEEICVDTQSVQ